MFGEVILMAPSSSPHPSPHSSPHKIRSKNAVHRIVLACQELARPDLVTQPHSGPSCTFIIHCKVIDQTAPSSLGNLPSPWSYPFLCNHGCQHLPSQVCFPPHSRIGRRLTTRSRGWGWEGKATRESDLLGEDAGNCPRGQVMDNVGTLPYN